MSKNPVDGSPIGSGSSRSPSATSPRSPRGSCSPVRRSASGGRSPSSSLKKSPLSLYRRTGRIPDTLNSEFLYYSSVLKIVAPALSSELDRKKIIPWVKKLFRPEYHSAQFREKRNKFLLCLTLTLLNDEAFGLFKTEPPEGALPEIEDLQTKELVLPDWELDKSWDEVIDNLPDNFQTLACSVHSCREDCEDDHALDEILDQEFQFFLYLSKPYATMVKGRYDRTKVAMWLQTLCSIRDNACSSMKGIRNDYMMSLLGYVHSLRLAGPFLEYPPWRTLSPLAEAARLSAESRPITDPTSTDVNEFLSNQPVPDEGAFCYISITGDLVQSGPS